LASPAVWIFWGPRLFWVKKNYHLFALPVTFFLTCAMWICNFVRVGNFESRKQKSVFFVSVHIFDFQKFQFIWVAFFNKNPHTWLLVMKNRSKLMLYDMGNVINYRIIFNTVVRVKFSMLCNQVCVFFVGVHVQTPKISIHIGCVSRQKCAHLIAIHENFHYLNLFSIQLFPHPHFFYRKTKLAFNSKNPTVKFQHYLHFSKTR
jgi:hypothetical protein